MTEIQKISGKGISFCRRMTVKFICIAVTAALVQVFIFVSVYMLWGAASAERKISYQNLKDIVSTRSKFIENYLENEYNVAVHYQESIADIINESSEVFFNENGKNPCGNRLFNEQLIENIYNNVSDLIGMSRSGGAFVVLANDSVSDFHEGFYIRLNDNDDRELLVGDNSLAEKWGIDLAEKWQDKFRVNSSIRCNYYNKVVEAFNEKGISRNINCCYISPKFILHGDNKEIITYTMPLIDSNGQLFGIIGLEIDVDDLISALPYSELSSGSDNMYYIAYRDSDSKKLNNEVLSASAGSDVSDKDDVLEYTNLRSSSFLQVKTENNSFIASIQKLNLRELQINAEDNEWMLLGVVNKNSLLSSYNSNLIHTIIMLVIILMMGIGICSYCVLYFSRKIRKMAIQVRDNSPLLEWHIDKSGLCELEFMGDVCKELFDKSLSYAKMAQTIDLVNMHIGAIEYDKNQDYVFCMDRTIDILELHNNDKEGQYMSRKHFDAEMDVLSKSLKPYEEENDTYCMISKSGKEKYIRIKQMNYESKLLMAVMDVTDEVIERKKIEYERDHDILTHLLNRRAFKSQAAQIFKREDLGIAAIVMIDLDNLKYFNDTYGHDYGDKYICAAAAVLSTVVDEKALAARMSGDEFLIFLHGYDDKEEIKEIIENVHHYLKESFVLVPSGEKIKLRASAGISWYPEDASTLEELIRFADFAMYESKNNMKGTVKEFDENQFKRNEVLFSGSEELNKLLDNPDNVKYAFHPIIDAVSGEIFAYEVLMRPQIEALRSPEDVMRLATAQSRLYDVEYMTWNEALRAADAQRKPGDKFKFFINSVPNHELKSDDLNKIVDAYGHLLNRVVIEIIENEQTDKHCMESKFKWAESFGMSIALDDFGTGYSNESTLLYINPQFVKIDMSMIMGIHNDNNRKKIVQNLLSYTKPRGIKVIAEGIETLEDMEALIKLGVDYMQGWYFMKPQFEIKDLDERFKNEIKRCNRMK